MSLLFQASFSTEVVYGLRLCGDMKIGLSFINLNLHLSLQKPCKGFEQMLPKTTIFKTDKYADCKI